MTKEQAIERLKRIDVKFFISGMNEASNYIIDEADKVNNAIETVLSMLKEKDNMIDLLIDKLNQNYTAVFKNNEVKEIIEIYEKIKNISNLSGIKLRKECIKQYFERKSEE